MQSWDDFIHNRKPALVLQAPPSQHYPAITEEDEEHCRKGEALLPELKSLEFLQQRKLVLTQAPLKAALRPAGLRCDTRWSDYRAES